MPHAFTTVASFTEALSRALEKYQIDAGDLFEQAGLPREPYRDPDARIPVDLLEQVWQEAERLTGNPCIGFEVGMELKASNFHAVGYACLGSASLREALERMVRYQRLLSTAADAALERLGETTVFLVHGGKLTHRGLDAFFCALLQICRDVSHADFAPLQVQMVREVPTCADQVADFMKCEITYGADDNTIVFSSATLDEPLPRTNPAMALASEQVAQQYLARMDKSDTVSNARRLLISHLPDGEPSRRRLAEALHMSERTLARRLSEAEYTFTALVDEIRQHLATDYLRQSHFSVTDVAFLLGFSDQSNFARAFKRWTGKSPSDFRPGKEKTVSR